MSYQPYPFAHNSPGSQSAQSGQSFGPSSPSYNPPAGPSSAPGPQQYAGNSGQHGQQAYGAQPMYYASPQQQQQPQQRQQHYSPAGSNQPTHQSAGSGVSVHQQYAYPPVPQYGVTHSHQGYPPAVHQHHPQQYQQYHQPPHPQQQQQQQQSYVPSYSQGSTSGPSGSYPPVYVMGGPPQAGPNTSTPVYYMMPSQPTSSNAMASPVMFSQPGTYVLAQPGANPSQPSGSDPSTDTTSADSRRDRLANNGQVFSRSREACRERKDKTLEAYERLDGSIKAVAKELNLPYRMVQGTVRRHRRKMLKEKGSVPETFKRRVIGRPRSLTKEEESIIYEVYMANRNRGLSHRGMHDLCVRKVGKTFGRMTLFHIISEQEDRRRAKQEADAARAAQGNKQTPATTSPSGSPAIAERETAEKSPAKELGEHSDEELCITDPSPRTSEAAGDDGDDSTECASGDVGAEDDEQR